MGNLTEVAIFNQGTPPPPTTIPYTKYLPSAGGASTGGLVAPQPYSTINSTAKEALVIYTVPSAGGIEAISLDSNTATTCSSLAPCLYSSYKGYFPKGTSITLNALNYGNYNFLKWVCTGPGCASGGYNGTLSLQSVTLNGNMTETAVFANTSTTTLKSTSTVQQSSTTILYQASTTIAASQSANKTTTTGHESIWSQIVYFFTHIKL